MIAAICTVNWAEAAQRILCEPGPRERGAAAADDARVRLEAVGLTIEPFLREDAHQAALLRLPTRELGLSLGDRSCLALARRLGVPALTADRIWARLPPDLGLEVELIR